MINSSRDIIFGVGLRCAVDLLSKPFINYTPPPRAQPASTHSPPPSPHQHHRQKHVLRDRLPEMVWFVLYVATLDVDILYGDGVDWALNP